ncbi:MAG: FAD:protein FMN transferase [Candidatus Omnitrophota bacterium]
METFKKEDMVLGTWGEITCLGKENICRRSLEKAFNEIRNLEKILSFFHPESEVTLINRAQGKPVKVRKETFEVVKKAKEISQKTDGAFDITVAPLLEIWGFYDREKRVSPSSELVKKTLSSIGEDKIILSEDKGTITLNNPATKIDLGGIAKGYIVDRAIISLQNDGIKNALVNIGGDIFVLGEKNFRNPWQVGIQDPEDKEKIILTLRLKNKAIATSGQYENFRGFSGKKLGHIIDPRTGYPVENEILSVTVVASDCLTADALATAIFVLGKEKAPALLKEFCADAIIITKTKKGKHIWISKGLKNKVFY